MRTLSSWIPIHSLATLGGHRGALCRPGCGNASRPVLVAVARRRRPSPADEAGQGCLELAGADVDPLDDPAVEHRGRDRGAAALGLEAGELDEDHALEA